MKPSSESSAQAEGPPPRWDFELPMEAAPASLPPLVSLETMMRRNRQLREWFPAGIRSPEERWQAKTDVEFRLDQP
jgi:hypothetical protein